MEEQSGGSVAPPPPAGAPALASVALTALAPTAGSCRIRLCGVSGGDLVGVSHNLIATGNSREPRESTKTPILQRRSLKNGPEVKQCVRGSAGCISERAAARAQLTGSLCPLPGHHAASEASPFRTLCLREHPPLVAAWTCLLCASALSRSIPAPCTRRPVESFSLRGLGAPGGVGSLVRLAKAASVLVFQRPLCFQSCLLTGVRRRELKV